MQTNDNYPHGQKGLAVRIMDKVKRFGSPRRGFSATTDSTSTTSLQTIDELSESISETSAAPDTDECKYAAETTPHKTIFTAIYETKALGNDGSHHYSGSSGTGCTYEYNRDDFVPFLRKFIIDNQIKSVVDLGCGSLGYDRKLYSELAIKSYHGYDVYGCVQEHNRRFTNHKKYHFYTMDFLVHREEIVPADLCIIKDVLQHWLLADITTLLDYLVASRKFKYIMIVNCYPQPPADWCGDMRREWPGFKTGDWRKMSCKYLPLSKYNPKPIFYYKTKEVSVIQCYLFGGSDSTGTAVLRHMSPLPR